MSEVWYIGPDHCYECGGQDSQIHTSDPDTNRALKLEIPPGLLRDYENAKRVLGRYEEELAPYIQSAHEAERERQRKYWEQYRREHPEAPTGIAGLLQSAYNKLSDFSLKTQPLHKDIR